MIRNLLFLAFIASSFLLNAQINVTVTIDHQLGGENFALNQTATTNMSEDVQFTRFEYYLSNFKITHDGGTVTPVEGIYALVQATDEMTSINLGDLDVTSIEGVSFSVGVDEATNHEDPSQYGPNNPLAPQNPSMHWGWAAGYRFAAIEGVSGASMADVFQVHALGDINYFSTEITADDLAFIQPSQGFVIPLVGDYTRVLENVSVDGGLIVHGEEGESVTVLGNFRDVVFTPAAVVNNVNDFSAVETFKVFPNPTVGNKVSVQLELLNTEATQMQLINALGQIIRTTNIDANTRSFEVELPSTGLYFLNINQNGQTVATHRVIRQ